jgi:hypothetical protein
LGAKKGGGGGLARLDPFSGLFAAFFRGLFLGLCMTIILAVFVLNRGILVLAMDLVTSQAQKDEDRVNGFGTARLRAFGGAGQGFQTGV